MATLGLFPDNFPSMVDRLGTTEKFISTDSEESFQANYNKISSYYQKADISYVHNEHGYRTRSFHNLPKKFGIAMGCSHTYGVGVRAEDTWHAELSRLSGLEFLNLGIESHGIQAITALTYQWHKYFALPEIVVIQLPNWNRHTSMYLEDPIDPDMDGPLGENWILAGTDSYVSANREMSDQVERDLSWEYQQAIAINANVSFWNSLGVPVRLWSYQNDHSMNRFCEYHIHGVQMCAEDIDSWLARDLSHQGHITQFRAAGELLEYVYSKRLHVKPQTTPLEITEESQKEHILQMRLNQDIIYN